MKSVHIGMIGEGESDRGEKENKHMYDCFRDEKKNESTMKKKRREIKVVGFVEERRNKRTEE